jgi:hypothetical protein
MTTPAEREFVVYRRGEVREIILREHREGLRLLDDLNTGAPFTEDTIRRSTARGSRFYREAEAIDIALLGTQKRDEFLAQQLRIDRAGSAFLRNYHASFWGEEYLPAFGASGTVAATGNAGTVWQGSTSLPDPLATVGTDSAGNRYQVVVSATADANGEATVAIVALDGGDATNLSADAVITWVNPPTGSAPTATVTADMQGGIDAETDADFAPRLSARIRHKPASGNWSHIRGFARAAANSVEDAFVYPCALNAGSVLVAITAKRGSGTGPNARIPGLSTLQAVVSFIVPPGSALFPGHVLVVVVPPVAESTNMVLQLDQAFGSTAGWADATPFPPINGTAAIQITTVTTQQDIRITTGAAGQLPGAVSGPLAGVSLMVWDDAVSQFVALDVTSVEDLGGGIYRVLLGTAPSKTLTVGDYVSPEMSRRTLVDEAVSAYFDSLGPGEVVDLDSSELGSRAFRNPVPSEEYPSRAGQGVTSFLSDALGSALTDVTLASVSTSEPTLPTDPVDGPSLLVAGKFAVYPF